MRCRNCGWENDLGAFKCDKCNAPLSGSMIDNHQHSQREKESFEPILKKTVRECDALHDMNDNLRRCSSCGYLYNSEMDNCPNCGKPFKMGTVNPWAKPQNTSSCSLTPIAWENEIMTPDAIKYSGNSIVLNRYNTDPENNSITSKEQAVLTCEDGIWFIEDKSQMQTTYLHVSKKTKLEDGAIIILGNRRFIFKK